MNPNNPQISNTINGSTINGGNVAIGNNGNINQTNNNYITHQNSNEYIEVFGTLSIYLKSDKQYQDFDPYVPFSCMAEITEDRTTRTTNYTLFTDYLYLDNYQRSYTSEFDYYYQFRNDNNKYLRRIFRNMIDELKKIGFYFKEDEKFILDTSIGNPSLSALKSFTGSEHKCFLRIYDNFISIDKKNTQVCTMYQ